MGVKDQPHELHIEYDLAGQVISVNMQWQTCGELTDQATERTFEVVKKSDPLYIHRDRMSDQYKRSIAQFIVDTMREHDRIAAVDANS